MPKLGIDREPERQGRSLALVGLWLALVLVLPTGSVLASHRYLLSFEPSEAVPGDKAEAFMELLEPGTSVDLHWTSCQGSLLASGTVNADGTLTLPFVVPQDAPPGDTEIWVCGNEAVADEGWPFTVVAPDSSGATSAEPSVELSQQAGIPGTVVVVAGSGFPEGEWDVGLGGPELVIGSARAGPDGDLEGAGRVPLDASEGPTSIAVCSFDVDTGTTCYEEPFEVTPPTLVIDPIEFHPSDTFRVSGEGWCCGNDIGSVVDAGDGVEWGTTTVDDAGVMEGVVTVPPDEPARETVLEVCVVERCREVTVLVLEVVVATTQGTVPPTSQVTVTTTVVTTIVPDEERCAILSDTLAVTPASGVAGTPVEISVTAAEDSLPGCPFAAFMAGEQVAGSFELDPGVGRTLTGEVPAGVAAGTNTLEVVDMGTGLVVASMVFDIEGNELPWDLILGVALVLAMLVGAAVLLAKIVRAVVRRMRRRPVPQPPVEVEPAPLASVAAHVTPSIRVPANVEAGRPFVALVGLHPDAGTRLPDLVIDAQLIADGFELGDTVRQRITGGGGGPASVPYPLTPDPVEEPATLRIVAHLYDKGHLVGWAQAEPVVHPAGAKPVPGGTAPVASVPLGKPDGPPPDLTVTITRGHDERFLMWGFDSPHPISLPTGQVRSDLGKDNARAFAHDEVLSLAATDPELVGMQLRGVAGQIGGRIPATAWQMLREVVPYAASAGRPPALLIVSEETYVPWELAAVPDDLVIDQAAPHLLGAQVVVGRWMPPDAADGLDPDFPRLPPTATLEVESMVVVVHTEGGDAAPPLPYAREEATALASSYGAVTVPAATGPVAGLLELRYRVEGEVAAPAVLHLTCHGNVDPDKPSRSGIVLMSADGAWVPLTPAMLRGAHLLPASQPLVFINACATGTPQEALDGFGGLVGAALKSGARGVVAPLWKVDDRPARDVALDLYEGSFSGRAMGDALRGVRVASTRTERVDRSFLAYVFFGHPMLRMSTAQRQPVSDVNVEEAKAG